MTQGSRLWLCASLSTVPFPFQIRILLQTFRKQKGCTMSSCFWKKKSKNFWTLQMEFSCKFLARIRNLSQFVFFYLPNICLTWIFTCSLNDWKLCLGNSEVCSRTFFTVEFKWKTNAVFFLGRTANSAILTNRTLCCIGVCGVRNRRCVRSSGRRSGRRGVCIVPHDHGTDHNERYNHIVIHLWNENIGNSQRWIKRTTIPDFFHVTEVLEYT